MAYEFHYTPTGTGAISGAEVLEQTEDAINDLGNTAISDVQEALDKAEQALTNSENAVDDAQTALNTANTAEGVAIQAQNDVSNLSGTVTNIGNRVTTAEGNISNLKGRMTTAEGNITNLQGRMTNAEGNIGNLQTAVSTAQATANSAQQTATTARQQSYVFRYSSTALTASSTNSNTLLDNTDNLKVGDKVIDSSGVLFSITAIDTTNSTFTIGTALIDLAQDSDVMHLSGDESALGIKAFIGTRTEFKRSNSDGVILFGNGSFTKGSASNDTINICRKYYGDATSIGSVLGYSSVTVSNNGNKTTYQFYCIDNTPGSTSRTTIQMNYDKSLSGTNAQYINISGSLLPSTDNSYSLGNSTNKWSSINGLEPSALGMPDLSNGIDISSYFDISLYTGQTYTPIANGWISISITSPNRGSLLCESVGISQTAYGVTDPDDNNKYRVSILVPCQASQTLTTYIRASGGTVNFAKFYPCLGNV